MAAAGSTLEAFQEGIKALNRLSTKQIARAMKKFDHVNNNESEGELDTNSKEEASKSVILKK